MKDSIDEKTSGPGPLEEKRKRTSPQAMRCGDGFLVECSSQRLAIKCSIGEIISSLLRRHSLMAASKSACAEGCSRRAYAEAEAKVSYERPDGRNFFVPTLADRQR